MEFNPYPFTLLKKLLKNVESSQDDINLSIGEPSFKAPDDVIKSIQENAELIRFYPKNDIDFQLLKKSQINFVKNRFKVDLKNEEIIPTFGTREALFNFPLFVLFDINEPYIAFPNPFYQIYEGATIASNAQPIYMDLNHINNFKPSLKKSDLKKVSLVILNSPNNPTGQILNIKELEYWVKLALEYNFYLLNDECYSEIYVDDKPPSILEACINVGNTEFKNVFAINSISKRICVPGLRSGFIAGDKEILNKYVVFRSYAGLTIPLTLQKASRVAWENYNYAEIIRKKFAKNIEIAKNIFSNSMIFPYSFYLWLKIQDCDEIHLGDNRLFSDEIFALELKKKKGITVLPGSYLGRHNVGYGYVRIALVYEENIMTDGLLKIKDFLDSFIKKYACQR